MTEREFHDWFTKLAFDTWLAGAIPVFCEMKEIDVMAKLTAAARKKIPTAEFAGPGRTYPVPDRAHAVNAIARATQQVNAGNLSPSQGAKIKAKARKAGG